MAFILSYGPARAGGFVAPRLDGAELPVHDAPE
jgi:hypothetical protein